MYLQAAVTKAGIVTITSLCVSVNKPKTGSKDML